VPAAGPQLVAIADAYVAGAYGSKEFDPQAIRDLRVAGSEAVHLLFRSLAVGQWRYWIGQRLRALTRIERR
jgi:hypothetical protein